VESADLQRTAITHDTRDDPLRHAAWITWPSRWQVSSHPLHHGILLIPQPPMLSHEAAALELDRFLRREVQLPDTLYTHYRWQTGSGEFVEQVTRRHPAG
jgi:hypothetical protein